MIIGDPNTSYLNEKIVEVEKRLKRAYVDLKTAERNIDDDEECAYQLATKQKSNSTLARLKGQKSNLSKRNRKNPVLQDQISPSSTFRLAACLERI